jgi:hypothetical protein
MPFRNLLLADAFFAVLLVLASMHGWRFFLEILLVVIFANVYWGWYVPRCRK